MNKSKLGPDFKQAKQPKSFQDEWFYGGYQQIFYNPYMKPIYPGSDPKTVQLTSPLKRADPIEAQVYPVKIKDPKSKQQAKVEKVLHEYKMGTLKTHGRTVKSRRQAIAIALSEAGLSRK